ncbi:MAG: hypothetical protein ACTSPE_11260 [Candidatus Thorarchaeota archaeon]|nr:MAG: hypothetical protein DRO73_11125 [Candidatus Thorarchaeota archaeon]RLI61054.1 MAG: hypothetical protein DRO93_05390 [Candidatus Thorarchaeota archaeon]
MRAEKIKVEFSNLETHMGNFRRAKYKMKCNVTYEDMMLVMQGDKATARLHARNIANVYLEKKAVRLTAMNFEIQEGEDEPSVVSGSIRLEVGNNAEQWYRELWG